MAWYYGTYGCKHDGKINIVGPTKDRQRKADWHFLDYVQIAIGKNRKKIGKRQPKKLLKSPQRWSYQN